MKTDNLLAGLAATALGLVMTFGMPVSPRRVNQGLISAIIIVAFGAAAFLLFEIPIAFLVMAAAALGALLYRDAARFIKHALYDVTKYRRRDWWYRRIGQTIMGRRGGRDR